MIRAIFYSEFDNRLGPRVLYDAPPGSVSKAINITPYWRSQQEQWQKELREHHNHHHRHRQQQHGSDAAGRGSLEPQALPQATPLFEVINDYCITGPQLSGHLITVLVPALGVLASPHRPAECVQVVNYPLAISGSKYGRNALLFNLGMVLHEHAPAQLFTAALRKLSMTLQSMEAESEFLSTPALKDALGLLLPRVLRDMNATGECTLPLDARNLLSLKLPAPALALMYDSGNGTPVRPRSAEESHDGGAYEHGQQHKGVHPVARAQRFPAHPAGAWYTAHAMANQRLIPEVEEHHVPCLLVAPEQLADVDWDITVQRVMRFIDGAKCAEEIALESGVDSDRCRASLRVLLWHGCVVLVDLFRYSNVYALRPGVAGLMEAGAMKHYPWMKELHKFSSQPGSGGTGDWREQDPRRFVLDALALLHTGHNPIEEARSSAGPTSSHEEGPGKGTSGDFASWIDSPPRTEDNASDDYHDTPFDDHEWWTDEVLDMVTSLPTRKWHQEREERRRAKQRRRERAKRRRDRKLQGKSGEQTDLKPKVGAAAPGTAAEARRTTPESGGTNVAKERQKQIEHRSATKLGSRASSAAPQHKEWVVPVGSMLKEALQYSEEAVRTTAALSAEIASSGSTSSLFSTPHAVTPSSSPGQRTQIPVSQSPQSYRIGSYSSAYSSGSDGGGATIHGCQSSSSPLSSSYSKSSAAALQETNRPIPPPLQNSSQSLRSTGSSAASLSRSAPKPPLVPSQQVVGQQRWYPHQQTPPSPQLRPQNSAYQSQQSTQRLQPRLQQQGSPIGQRDSPGAPTSSPSEEHNLPRQESAPFTTSRAPGKYVARHPSLNGSPAGPQDVLDFYRGFGSGETVRSVVLKNATAPRDVGANPCRASAATGVAMDHRRLAAFGILHGILKRVHVYPICEVPKARLPAVIAEASRHLESSEFWSTGGGGGGGDGGGGGNGTILKDLISLMDGQHCMDAICTKFFITEKQIRSMVKSLSDVQPAGSPSISYVYK